MTKPIVENLKVKEEDMLVEDNEDNDNEDPLAGDVDPMGYYDPDDPYNNNPFYNPMDDWTHHSGEVF